MNDIRIFESFGRVFTALAEIAKAGLSTRSGGIAYGKTLFDEKMSDYAKYFLEIAYSMVPAPEIKKMLDSLGGVIGKVDILKYLDLPKEFQPVRNRPTDPINCESFMMQNTYTAALLQVYPIDVEGTMPFQNPQSVIDGVHRSVKDNQALIEVENGIFDNSAFIYSIVKTLHEQKFTGVQYFMLMHVLIDGKVVKTGGPELAMKIENEGFEFIIHNS